jgi:hypothetical protein
MAANAEEEQCNDALQASFLRYSVFHGSSDEHTPPFSRYRTFDSDFGCNTYGPGVDYYKSHDPFEIHDVLTSDPIPEPLEPPTAVEVDPVQLPPRKGRQDGQRQKRKGLEPLSFQLELSDDPSILNGKPIAKNTVAELKAYLRFRKLPVSGRKDELVDL